MSPVKTDAYSLDELRLFAENPVKLRAQVPFREASNPVLAIREFYVSSEVPSVPGTTPHRRGRVERIYAERHKPLMWRSYVQRTQAWLVEEHA